MRSRQVPDASARRAEDSPAQIMERLRISHGPEQDAMALEPLRRGEAQDDGSAHEGANQLLDDRAGADLVLAAERHVGRNQPMLDGIDPRAYAVHDPSRWLRKEQAQLPPHPRGHPSVRRRVSSMAVPIAISRHTATYGQAPGIAGTPTVPWLMQ